MCVYGFTNSSCKKEQGILNEKLLGAACAVMAGIGKQPALLAGDLNVRYDCSPLLVSQTEKGVLRDFAQMAATNAGIDRLDSTCFPQISSPGTRIDYIYGNALASHAFASFRVLREEECPVPTHRALEATLRLEQTRQPILRLRKAEQMSFSPLTSKEGEVQEVATHIQPIIEDYGGDWALACEWGNTAWALELLSKMSEEYLARNTGSRWVHPNQRGHGEIRLRQTLTQAPSQGMGQEDSASTARLVRLQKFLRRTEEIGRIFFLRGRERVNCEQDAKQLWDATLKDARWATGDHASDLTTTDLPGMSWLGELLREARRCVQEEKKQCVERRAQEWREDVGTMWQKSPRELFSLLKDDSKQGVTMLLRSDGTLTSSLAEVDELLRKEWLPILQKYSPKTAKSEPTWKDFQARFGSHVPQRCNGAVDPLTADILRATLGRMSNSASLGAGGWSVGELKQLPDQLLEMICQLCHLIEQTGRWPEALSLGLITPIVKDELRPLTAGNTRPITVMPLLYRLWASARVRQLLDWQQQWISPCVYSYRPEHGCEDAWLEEALRVEKALLSGEPLCGLSIDLAKAFDSLPQSILLMLAEEVGMDANVLRALRGMYACLRRRLTVDEHVGEAFSSTNGIMQCCPISVLLIMQTT